MQRMEGFCLTLLGFTGIVLDATGTGQVERHGVLSSVFCI